MFACLHVCIYGMLLLLEALHLRHQNCQGFFYDPHGGVVSVFFFFLTHPAIALSMNNRITIGSYYVQLSTMLCEQLRT